MAERVRPRFVLALLCGLLAWFVWAEQQRAEDELGAVRLERTRSASEGAATRQEAEARAKLRRVVEQLGERVSPPASAAAVRDAFLQAAGVQGVELSASRLQPLVRPPSGTVGTEARITLLGDPAALSRFLSTLVGRRWPLRTGRANLAVRGGLGTLTATVVVLWPAPDGSFGAGDAARLASDPGMEDLLAWLESAPGPEVMGAAPTAEPAGEAPDPSADPAPAVGGETVPDVEAPGVSSVVSSGPAPPKLRGFVDVGPGVPLRAALFYRGETTLVAVGDQLGEYTVVILQPSEAVVLSRGAGPPLRLVLR